MKVTKDGTEDGTEEGTEEGMGSRQLAQEQSQWMDRDISDPCPTNQRLVTSQVHH